MLKVTVAEVQRSLLKQFGINLGAAINAGNFSTTLLTDNALPLTAAAGLGKLPIPGFSTATPTRQRLCARLAHFCNYNHGPAASTFGNSGVDRRLDAGSDARSRTPSARSSATAWSARSPSRT